MNAELILDAITDIVDAAEVEAAGTYDGDDVRDQRLQVAFQRGAQWAVAVLQRRMRDAIDRGEL